MKKGFDENVAQVKPVPVRAATGRIAGMRQIWSGGSQATSHRARAAEADASARLLTVRALLGIAGEAVREAVARVEAAERELEARRTDFERLTRELERLEREHRARLQAREGLEALEAHDERKRATSELLPVSREALRRLTSP